MVLSRNNIKYKTIKIHSDSWISDIDVNLPITTSLLTYSWLEGAITVKMQLAVVTGNMERYFLSSRHTTFLLVGSETWGKKYLRMTSRKKDSSNHQQTNKAIKSGFEINWIFHIFIFPKMFNYSLNFNNWPVSCEFALIFQKHLNKDLGGRTKNTKNILHCFSFELTKPQKHHQSTWSPTCDWSITSQRSVLFCMSCPLRGSRSRIFTSTRPPVGLRPSITCHGKHESDVSETRPVGIRLDKTSYKLQQCI